MSERRRHAIGLALAVVWVVRGPTPVAGQQNQPINQERTIVSVRGDLYLARLDWRATVFLVTADGIVVGDPVSVEHARWLREELAKRFPGRPVRYVLHSHHHFDRASGAAVFDAATTVGHRLFNVKLRDVGRSANYADVRPVARVFDTRESVTLGGKTVQLIYTGRGHAADMSALYFPEERVLFVVDGPPVTSSPLSFGPYYSPHEVSAWLDAVSALEFDTLLIGDGSSIDAAAPKSLKPYVDDLLAAVTDAVTSGRTLSQTRAEVLLPAHRSSPHYAARVAQIDSVYRSLAFRAWSLYGAGAMNHLTESSAYCQGFSPCDPPGGTLSAISAGIDVSFGRYGLAVEGAMRGQSLGSRTSRFYDDDVANRRTSATFLVRYAVPDMGAVAAALVGGVTLTVSDTRGFDRVKEAAVPFGGRHPIVSRDTLPGYTVGVDLSVAATPRWRLRFPIRLTSNEKSASEFHPGSMDVQVGVGMGFRLARRVTRIPGRSAPIIMRRP
jgi:glyoxylase-like metal-dependent hydrolase (beta-lactamase superfamily II)